MQRSAAAAVAQGRMGLFQIMQAGFVVLGRLADSRRRRPTMLLCIIVMTLGMAAIYWTQSTTQIIFVRILTGLGIGGMLACTTAMVARFSNTANKNMNIMIGGRLSARDRPRRRFARGWSEPERCVRHCFNWFAAGPCCTRLVLAASVS